MIIERRVIIGENFGLLYGKVLSISYVAFRPINTFTCLVIRIIVGA